MSETDCQGRSRRSGHGHKMATKTLTNSLLKLHWNVYLCSATDHPIALQLVSVTTTVERECKLISSGETIRDRKWKSHMTKMAATPRGVPGNRAPSLFSTSHYVVGPLIKSRLRPCPDCELLAVAMYNQSPLTCSQPTSRIFCSDRTRPCTTNIYTCNEMLLTNNGAL